MSASNTTKGDPSQRLYPPEPALGLAGAEVPLLAFRLIEVRGEQADRALRTAWRLAAHEGRAGLRAMSRCGVAFS